jgi:hypothetical protein
MRAGVFAGATLWLTPALAAGVHAFGRVDCSYIGDPVRRGGVRECARGGR